MFVIFYRWPLIVFVVISAKRGKLRHFLMKRLFHKSLQNGGIWKPPWISHGKSWQKKPDLKSLFKQSFSYIKRVVQDELAGMGWPKSRDQAKWKSRSKSKVEMNKNSLNTFFQLRFLISQGIDHLVTLSSDKLPPHYAFPELKWTLIPVEDFTGPTISEIKKFINIIDEARRNGEVSFFWQSLVFLPCILKQHKYTFLAGVKVNIFNWNKSF